MPPQISETELKAALPLLDHVPIFSSLKKAQLKSIGEASTVKSYAEDDLITKQGEEGVAFYLILDGEVEVRRGKRTLAKLGKGQFFGELSVIDMSPRTADVVVVKGPAKCLLLTRWTFRALIKSSPDIALTMLEEMARRLRATDQSISDDLPSISS